MKFRTFHEHNRICDSKMCGYKPVLLILGLLSLVAWVAWLVVLIPIKTGDVLHTTCTIKMETYPPYLAVRYGLVYNNFDTIYCTDTLEDGSCGAYTQNQIVTCYVYYDSARNFWYSFLDRTSAECDLSQKCDLSVLLFAIAAFSTGAFTLIVLITMIILMICERKNRSSRGERPLEYEMAQLVEST